LAVSVRTVKCLFWPLVDWRKDHLHNGKMAAESCSFENKRTQVAVFRWNPPEIGEPRENAALEITKYCACHAAIRSKD
jgi:hypothetical protein